MAASIISLKLVIDAEGKRVLFAEAGKDFVDFLLHLLTLPVGKLISLAGGPQRDMVGSLSNLYGGLQNLGELYVDSVPNKNHVLNPAVTGVSIPLLGIKYINPTSQKKFYLCNNVYGYGYNCTYNYNFTDNPTGICPVCKSTSSRDLNYVAPPNNSGNLEGGVVTGEVKYLVMDDLDVMPMTTFNTSSCIAMMKAFHDVKNVDALEERVVNLGMDEAVKLVRAAMQTKNVLTSVFSKALTTAS